jgi:hypothetical protein
MRKRSDQLPSNPFEGKDRDEVLKELLAQSIPISREVAMEKMIAASKAQMRMKKDK